jgi:protein-L-isoaspartate(D-aspartate) O-methyltransferase
MQKELLLAQFRRSGIPEPVIKAFAQVRREDFVPDEFALHAYDDVPIPLPEAESSLSQPSTAALMLQLLDVRPKQRILEIGSGSGFVLALLAELAIEGEIFGVEINTRLAALSKKRLLHLPQVHVFNLDGSLGLPQQAEQAPFDRILISASAPDLGTIYQILDQLKDPGILVAPVKDSLFQIKKTNRKIEKIEFPGFRFVKLVKKEF